MICIYVLAILQENCEQSITISTDPEGPEFDRPAGKAFAFTQVTRVRPLASHRAPEHRQKRSLSAQPEDELWASQGVTLKEKKFFN